MTASLQNLAIHTITTKPWPLETALDKYAAKGIGGISVWEDAIKPMGAVRAGELIQESGLRVVSYVRGGFFPSRQAADRKKAIDHNRKLLEEAAAIGAPQLVLVCGADPAQPLKTSRSQIQTGIESLLPMAESLQVQLAIEPLHPMYAGARSAINTLAQANEMAETFQSDWVGVAVDVYHLWWDPQLETEIDRCGQHGNLLAYHICDWKVPTEHMLTDRGLMGDGCIPVSQISKWIQKAGFRGFHEVEIFSDHYWQMDQDEFLDRIISAYLAIPPNH